MKFLSFLKRIIEFSFYSLFLLVPLVFSGATSELFEFPKMWLTFGLSVAIGTAWIAKMILQRRIHVQRTPLDIPIFLFVASQIVSTIFSIDQHVSLWGYYSRFNGGLYSIITYIFLYYAFVSNLQKEQVKKVLKASLISGFLVALWGLPSHFGYDPTCLIFRGNLDTSCWTEAFKPTIRIFSTLGQPAWLAAYMSVLIPLATAFSLLKLNGENWKLEVKNWKLKFFAILTLLFYMCLTYTDTRGGFIGFWVANVIFWALIYVKKLFDKKVFLRCFLIFNFLFLTFNFLQGVPISQINKFTYPELIKHSTSTKTTMKPSAPVAGALGGTDSGKIRLLVWRGAINAWKDNKLVGTGVETFAFAYYKYKPTEHNITSEWDYLYNKAHNEYLNYLTTTGAFGLGTYLSLIAVFFFVVYKKFKSKSENLLINFALIAGYISILISNFFGFSVVIINLYFFLIPAFVFILGDFLNDKKVINRSFGDVKQNKINRYQWTLLVVLLIASGYKSMALINYWNSDISYSLGKGLGDASEFQKSLPYIQKAYVLKPDEPVYADELSSNLATLAGAFYLQKDASTGAQLAQTAIDFNDKVIDSHPNNIVYLKNRVRIFYTLAQSDTKNEQKYYKEALVTLNKAQILAPTDAKISYSLGVLQNQMGDTKKAIEILNQTTKLKPNYRDAYFALGLLYEEVGETQKAIDSYKYILENIDPQDQKAQDNLKKLSQ